MCHIRIHKLFKLSYPRRRVSSLRGSDEVRAGLSLSVGVARQTILALEAQKYSPSLELAFRIAVAFDRPLEYIFQFNQK